MNSYEYLLKDISSIKGIGTKLSKLFKKKNINTIFDLLWSLPRDTIDRSNLVKINELQIGKIQTITVDIKKYNFLLEKEGWNTKIKDILNLNNEG